MKLCKVSFFVALLVAVCLPAVGQTQIQSNIPFNFFAAGKSMPAGHYTVAQVSDRNVSAWWLFGDHGAVMMLTNSIQSPQKAHRPSLVFWYNGDTYSLVQIWSSEHAGRDLPLRWAVKSTILAEGGQYPGSGKYVEVGAE